MMQVGVAIVAWFGPAVEVSNCVNVALCISLVASSRNECVLRRDGASLPRRRVTPRVIVRHEKMIGWDGCGEGRRPQSLRSHSRVRGARAKLPLHCRNVVS